TPGPGEVPALAGAPAGQRLLVNDADPSYAKLRLAGAGAPLPLPPRVPDPPARPRGRAAAWGAPRRGGPPGRRLVELAAAALPHETHVPLYETMCATVCDQVVDRYLPPVRRPLALATMAGVARQVLSAAEPGSAWQLAGARGLIRCAGAEDVD